MTEAIPSRVVARKGRRSACIIKIELGRGSAEVEGGKGRLMQSHAKARRVDIVG